MIVFLLSALSLTSAYSPHLSKPTNPPPSLPTRAIDRRTWLATSAAAAPSLLPFYANAAADLKLETFNDATHGFSLKVPADWQQSEQTLPDRRKLSMWRDPTDESTLLFIAYTPVRDDFTSLGSFGSVNEVAAQTIMPKGQIMGVEQDDAAQMLSATSEKSAYLFDYLQSLPTPAGGTTPTHFRTIFALQSGATGGAGSVLVTITAQSPESRYSSQLKPAFDSMIKSYGKSV